MRRTYKYKIKMNKKTEKSCLSWLYLCRVLYNMALSQRVNAYRQHRISLTSYEQIKQLPELKEAHPEFKDVGSQCLQDVIERLDKAYKAFFRRIKGNHGKAGFPRFKGSNRYDSFTLKQTGWRLEGRYLHIKNIGRLKLFLSRPVEGKIKTVTLRKSSTGEWFVMFSCVDTPRREYPETDKAVGIDMGIRSFCVDSDNHIEPHPSYLKKSLKILRRKQRSLARKKKGSNRRNKARVLVAKIHEKIRNQRKDFLHKRANHYIEKYKEIAVENLNINGMVKNHHLAQSIADSSWGMFFNFLAYKAEEADRHIVKVSPHYTSQLCSSCGEKVIKSLAVRVHECPHCGLSIDRDYNAALNIRNKALGHRVRMLTDRVACGCS